MNPIPDTSASLTFDGTTYASLDDDAVSYLEIEVNRVTSFAISATVINGTDTLSLGLIIPEREVATYTKATNDTDAGISVLRDLTSTYATAGVDSDEGLTDYTITITDVSGSTISGTFTATLYDFLNEDSAEASGSFVAVDFANLIF